MHIPYLSIHIKCQNYSRVLITIKQIISGKEEVTMRHLIMTFTVFRCA